MIIIIPILAVLIVFGILGWLTTESRDPDRYTVVRVPYGYRVYDRDRSRDVRGRFSTYFEATEYIRTH